MATRATSERKRNHREWRIAAVYALAGFLAAVILWVIIVGATLIVE